MGLPTILSMTIHLGCRLPDTSSDLPGGLCGPHSDTSLFGLAPGGVYLASSVTRRTGALLPHRFTLTPPSAGRFAFCCTCLRVTATPCYGAPCPAVFGLSSEPLRGPAIIWPASTAMALRISYHRIYSHHYSSLMAYNLSITTFGYMMR